MDPSQSINLEKSVNGDDLYQSHLQVIAYWSPYWDRMELYYDNLSGEMWTPEEKLVFKRKKKAPVVINDLKPAERTILGLFIQNKYDVKFAPREEAQDISDVLQKLYAWTAYTQDWNFKDIELVRQAWCGGVGYQEVYVKVTPGKEPQIITNALNPFSIAWDPESRDLINREDATFVDRDTWISYDDLSELWPDKVTSPDDLTSQGQQAFQQGKTYADRSTEFYDAKNNRYKVTERLYKVKRVKWFATDGQSKLEVQSPQDRAKYKQEGFDLHSETEEMLYLAIVCPAWQIGEYLYNGEYHCQPRDLFSDKIIWPILELVAESINGVPGGFVQHLVQINRLKNSAVATLFHAQKHASSTALVRKRKLFGADEAQATAFDANHSDADRVFVASDQSDLGADIAPVPKGIVSQDTDKTLEIAAQSFQAISSTPPALQGQAESSSTSGVLNSQRIEQSFVQLQVLIANIKHFLKRRAELVYYYWREYFTYPMKVRIVGGQQAQQADQAPGQPKPTHVGINQEQPVMDWQGQPTGAIEKINDISTARYDVDIEDSYQSPTYRAKRMQELSEIMQKAGNVDPNLMEALFVEYANSTDMAQETKDIINNAVKAKQEQANQPPAPPPLKPPNISWAFKGEDFNIPAVMEMAKESGALTPEAVHRLEQAPVPMSAADQAKTAIDAQAAQAGPAAIQEPINPMELEKHQAAMAKAQSDGEKHSAEMQRHAAEMKIHEAKLEGHHLDNTKKMQEIADKEAQVNAMVPSVENSLDAHPNAFSPRPTGPKQFRFHRGQDGKIAAATSVGSGESKHVEFQRGEDGKIIGALVKEMAE